MTIKRIWRDAVQEMKLCRERGRRKKEGEGTSSDNRKTTEFQVSVMELTCEPRVFSSFPSGERGYAEEPD